jgi:hypothetical protein
MQTRCTGEAGCVAFNINGIIPEKSDKIPFQKRLIKV